MFFKRGLQTNQPQSLIFMLLPILLTIPSSSVDRSDRIRLIVSTLEIMILGKLLYISHMSVNAFVPVFQTCLLDKQEKMNNVDPIQFVNFHFKM